MTEQHTQLKSDIRQNSISFQLFHVTDKPGMLVNCSLQAIGARSEVHVRNLRLISTVFVPNFKNAREGAVRYK